MKRQKQQGFAVLEALLIVIVIAVIAGVGYYVWQSRDDTKNTPTKTSTTTKQDTVPKITTDSKGITTVPDALVNTLTKKSDVDQLPSVTPASFKDYLRAKLPEVAPTKENCNTASTFSVNKISSVNVAGGASDGCQTSGAAAVWYLKDGQWYELDMQSSVSCTEVAKTTIYKEFLPNCYNTDTKKTEANPNGSITAATE